MVKDKECYCCLLPRSLPSGLGNLVDTFSQIGTGLSCTYDLRERSTS
jgi:hypothetical protein